MGFGTFFWLVLVGSGWFWVVLGAFVRIWDVWHLAPMVVGLSGSRYSLLSLLSSTRACARQSPRRHAEAVMNTPEDVLSDLGTALVAFGTALQQAGTRLQAIPRVRANNPQAKGPVPTAPPVSGMPTEGYVRIWNIIGRRAAKGHSSVPGMIPVSRATWYAGVKSGRFPRPIKHGRVAMWRMEDIRALIAQLEP